MTPALTPGASLNCPHGGKATILPGAARVLVGGQPLALLSDMTMVAGCAFAVGPKPQPCVKLLWLVGTTRVLAGGQPALVQAATGLCQSAEQIPQGPPIIVPGQTRVLAS